jgi:hypothetical protein
MPPESREPRTVPLLPTPPPAPTVDDEGNVERDASQLPPTRVRR